VRYGNQFSARLLEFVKNNYRRTLTVSGVDTAENAIEVLKEL
jgi:hypothetical protein